jgi:ABC-2 type transport system ATP-binding protein
MIEVENLTKYYGPKMAVENVSLRVEKGEIMGFLGPNGAGKTTTMRILTGYIPATRGNARVAGFDVFENSLEVRRRTGYVPENVPLYTDMVVRKYLSFVADIHGIPRAAKDDQIDKAVRDVGIEDVQYRIVGKLSKGYRQRVGLAQALLHDPEVLVLDEPTVGLDPRQIVDILDLIKGLAGRRTVILSTHRLEDVEHTCQKVTIIKEGRIVAADSLENLMRKAESTHEIEILASGDRKAILGTLRGVEGVQKAEEVSAESDSVFKFHVRAKEGMDIRAELCSAVVKNGFQLLEAQRQTFGLRDIYMEKVL